MSVALRALIVIALIDVMLGLAQMTVVAINPDADNFYNVDSSISQQGANQVDLGDVDSELPSAAGSSGNIISGALSIFTDPFNTLSSFWKTTKGVIDFVGRILNSLPNMLKMIGLPEGYVMLIGGVWHVITLFAVVGYMLGRD